MLVKLKAFRLEKEVTQKQISEAIGISESYYCQMENGSRRMSLLLAKEIAQFLNATLDELFMDTDLA
ncbi:helix-turn-helix transcriptional regulator [Pelotomaculum isophthalicicum]|uniref:helix-turn-helix transcriptional regulator n=1 Tax=Pelotomaculum isophthalicicum TaxID=342448 RepID=UPI003B8498C1